MFEKHNSLKSFLFVFIVYCVGMYLVPLSMMNYDLSRIPGGLGDSRLTNYFLEHGYKWITGQLKSFWDAPFFYPAIRVMSFADNHLGTLPVYSFFRYLNFDRETSYQLWFFTLFTLNYFCCLWALRKLRVNVLGAAAGAFVFAFSLPIIAQLNCGHTQLLPMFTIPPAYYFAWQYLEKQETKMFALTCLAVVIQFYCSMYIGFFLIVGLLAFLIAFIILEHNKAQTRKIFWRNYKATVFKAIIIGISIIILLPIIIPYYKTSLEYGTRSWAEITPMLPRLSSYFHAIEGSLLWGWLSQIGSTLPMYWEHRIFVGILPLLAFLGMPIFYVYHREEPLARKGMIAFITIGLLIMLILYVFEKYTLYKFALIIPGLESVRAVTRIIFVMLFPFSLILGIFISSISENERLARSPFVKIIVMSFIFLFLVLDQSVKTTGLGAYSKLDSQNRLKIIEEPLMKKRNEVKVFAYMPIKSADSDDIVHVDAMMAAQNLNLATVNGYSAKFPHYYFDIFYANYKSCDSIMKWKALSSYKYSKYYPNKEMFENLYIVGRDDYFDNVKSYTFMEKALPEDGYKAKIIFEQKLIATEKNKIFKLKILLKNDSSEIWRCLSSDNKGRYAIRLSYRWLSSNSSPIGNFDNRMSLPHDISPRKSASFNYTIQAPAVPGTYYLEFDLVQEHIAWFRDKGSSTAMIKVQIL